ncbi:MAG TPA: fibronectin type III domain-containing protein [Candidatus Saccharimonadales bacterium]|nr:fibronectin type III domain-containing protein [Candidatus Saccharimonadales bacterium]
MVIVKKRTNGQWQVLSGDHSNVVASDPPTGVTATTPTSGVARVVWTPPVFTGNGDILKYTIEASVNGGGVAKSVQANPEDRSTLVTGLTAGTSYTFRVAVINSFGTGGYSSATVPLAITTSNAYVLPDGLTIPAGWVNPATAGIFGAGAEYGDLTVHEGSLATTMNGQVIEDLDIHGNIEIKHNNVTVRRCRIRSTQTSTVITGGEGVVDGNKSTIDGLGNRIWLANNLLVEYCEVIGTDDPEINDQSGITSGGSTGITAHFNILHGMSDAITLNDNATVRSNIVYDIKVAEGSHADCFQITDGDNTVVEDNVLLCHTTTGAPVTGGDGVQRVNKDTGYGNAAIQLGAQTGPLTNLTINHNYLSGGYYTINSNNSGEGANGPITGAYTNNVFSGYQKYGPVANYGSGMTFDDSNVWEATRVTNSWSGPGDTIEKYYHLTAGTQVNGTAPTTTP